jgi:hypothetical protein
MRELLEHLDNSPWAHDAAAAAAIRTLIAERDLARSHRDSLAPTLIDVQRERLAALARIAELEAEAAQWQAAAQSATVRAEGLEDYAERTEPHEGAAAAVARIAELEALLREAKSLLYSKHYDGYLDTRETQKAGDVARRIDAALKEPTPMTDHREVVRLLREGAVDVTASLVAAVYLLKHGGKKAAPSDKMFGQMVLDYEASIERARAALATAEATEAEVERLNNRLPDLGGPHA